MKPFCPIIHGKEKENAGQQIKPQRMHITHAMPGEKLICQFPWTNEEEADCCKKLRVPIQELIEEVGKDVAKRTAVIDSWLATLRAPVSGQWCAAILAMR